MLFAAVGFPAAGGAVGSTREGDAVNDLLYSPGEDLRDTDDILRLIATAFRQVAIDRKRGDQVITDSHNKLAGMGCPEVILAGRRSVLGRTAWVTVADDDPDGGIEFLLEPPMESIFVKYKSADHHQRSQPVVRKLAGLLGYEVHPNWETVSLD